MRMCREECASHAVSFCVQQDMQVGQLGQQGQHKNWSYTGVLSAFAKPTLYLLTPQAIRAGNQQQPQLGTTTTKKCVLQPDVKPQHVGGFNMEAISAQIKAQKYLL